MSDPASVPSTPFAHASEAEMSRILDFYAVRWEYEPDTFPILWNLDGDVVEHERATRVEANGPAGRHDDRRVVLVDK